MLLFEVSFADEIVRRLWVTSGAHRYIALALIILFLVRADLC